MGYPGIRTDDIMDLVGKLQYMSEQCGRKGGRARLLLGDADYEVDAAECQKIVEEIRRLVSDLEDSCVKATNQLAW